MLKKWLRLLSPDVNTEGSSSESSDVKTEQSSSPETEGVKEPTEEGEKSTESEEVEESTTETEEQVTEKTEESETKLDQKHEEAIPYERFNEVNTQKTALEQELAQSKPLIDQSKALNDFLSQNNIATADFQSALEYLRLLRTDPSSAYRMLQPTYEKLASYAGDRLPADLQEEVAAAHLTPDRAKELAQLRAQGEYSKVQQGWNQQGVQQQTAQMINGAIQTWATSKQSIDPDFRPATNGKQGIWELTDTYIKGMPPCRNAGEAMQKSEEAYQQAKKFIAQFKAPPQQVRRGLTSKQSSTNSSAVLKTPEDVMKAIAAGVKPHQMRYS